MTIVEFLNARLDEEAKLAQRVADRYHRGTGESYWPLPSIAAGATRYNDPDIRAGFDLIRLYGPDRVLADIAAKRAIVAEFEQANARAEFPNYEGGYAGGLEEAVQLLASVYCDHPDYQQEWSA